MEPATGLKLSRTPVQVNPKPPSRPFVKFRARGGGVGVPWAGRFLPGQGTAAKLAGP